MRHNPFCHLQHVSSDNFSGRRLLIESIVQDLRTANGTSHAIIASQRCSKTRLLKALADQLRQPVILETDARLALPFYIDLKARTFDSAGAVFAFILDRVYRQISRVVHQHSYGLWPTPLRLGACWFEKLLSTPTLSARAFEDGLGYLIDLLDLPALPVRLVLMLDEIDGSLDQPWTAALYRQARGLMHSHDLRTRLSLVLTSSQHLLDQQGIYRAYWANVLKLHCLETLGRAEWAQRLAD